MDIVHERVCGMDISKRDVKVAVRLPGKRKGTFSTEVTTWGATAGQVLDLTEYLGKIGVTSVVMEATSDYWKPFYYVMEESLPVMLVNAKSARNIPGRKSDVSDAAWLAQLGAHGLLRASFVPPPAIRELRDLTRARTIAVRDQAKQKQRLEKFLESSGIKLSSVVSELLGVSGRSMLEALARGERDPEVLADLAHKRLRNKIPELVQALQGRFSEHHEFMVSQYLAQIDRHQEMITQLTGRIEHVIQREDFGGARDLLLTVPGVATRVADVIIAETGANMTVFPSAGHLASWAGVCPGMNESAGIVRSSHVTHGNAYLQGALGIAAMSAIRGKNNYLGAKYRRLAGRRGTMRALVAVQHSMLSAMWHMLQTGEIYNDPGQDYFTKLKPEKARHKAIRQLEQLGYQVSITPQKPD